MDDNKKDTDELNNELRTAQHPNFRAVFDRYYPSLCYFAEKLVQDSFAAEDIVEDVFLKLWLREPDFTKHKNIKAVLYIAVKNACIDFIRKRQRNIEKRNQLEYSLQQETETYALKEIIRTEILQEVYTELQKLPTECRKVMQLLFIEGWDNKKVAEHLKIGLGTVKTHKVRGIRALRKKFGISVFLIYLLTLF
jgi:RNA polymerase sigma-70 factor (ECF subfamily)